MILRHLRYFSAVAEHGSMVAAARALRVAQPSLSRQIGALESKIGVHLFERTRRGIRLTPAGGVLLTWIAFKLLVQEASDAEVSAANSLWQAIQTIILADMVMSMDNVLAVAAAAKGDLLLLALGIAISIPIIIWGSTFILYLLGRFPWLLFVGGGILAWTAGEIIVRDEFVLNLLAQRPGYTQVVPIAATLAILIAGWSYNGMKRRFG